MLIAEVQFSPWDKKYHFDCNSLPITRGDFVIVETSLGKEIGKAVEILDIAENKIKEFLSQYKDDSEKKDDNKSEDEILLKPIIRKATADDIKNMAGFEERKTAIKFCKEITAKHELPMKVVDVHFSLDQGRITFAFIADGRIDFRELVKDLTRHFNKSVRLHQIGIRDEAKLCGDCGPCGKTLCCKGFLKDLVSITSEMAEMQEVAHRGSERISGICGRLMCCLAYEQKGYKELLDKLPAVGTKVNKDGKRGVVVGVHPLKESIDVQFKEKEEDRGTFMEVSMKKK
jgi:cell fate regulator YaaT (PSP1 superfamily)